MDGESEENEVKCEKEEGVAVSNQEEINPVAENVHEVVPTKMVAPDLDKVSRKDNEDAPGEEEATTSEAEDTSGGAVDNTTSRDITEQPVSHEESVVFDIDIINNDDGPATLDLETPEREDISPTQEEEGEGDEEEQTNAASASKDDFNYGEYLKLYQELCEERDEANIHSSQLQMRLAERFRKDAIDDGQLERELLESEQLEGYDVQLNLLRELRQQLSTDSESAQQQAEELSLQCQEKLDKVENEWRAFMALKRDAAVSVLSRRLGKQVAQAKVESTLAAEQLRQDELIKLRLQNIKLKTKIHRLEARLRDGEEHTRDPVQVQFERLQAERLKLKKEAEKQNEEALMVERKISGSLEVLSNIKEKLCWSQAEVRAKREQLAEVEAAMASKKDILTRTKQACKRLQRDNQRLKEQRGLLGNTALLQDFGDTADASKQLEERLENLKDAREEIFFRCGRWKKRLAMPH